MTDEITGKKRDYTKLGWFALGACGGVLSVMAAGALLLPAAADARRGEWSEGHGGGGPMGHMMEMFQKADTDNSKSISLGEFKAAGMERFETMDTDGDGSISKDETLEHMIERLKQRVDKIYSRRDQDGDGSISEEEFAEQSLIMFGRLDRNFDGELSRKDMRRHGGDLGRGFGGHHGKPDMNGDKPEPGEAGDR